jgi:signal peptidase I
VLANRPASIPLQRSFGGDRILVNKYLYTLTDPERWDVIVFHYPGNSEQNYIKRLVGLPGETLRIFQGDLFVGGPNAAGPPDFSIARKPPDKVLAVRQLVHDTDFDPAELFAADWPLRWIDSEHAWKMDQPQLEGGNVRQRYSVDTTDGGEAWLRYNHFAPDEQVWNELARLRAANPAGGAKFAADFPHADRRQLIMDFNAYNTRVTRQAAIENQLGNKPALDPGHYRHGLHWVGDLMIEADVQVESAQGELLLNLVEGGKHFTCRIDLATGRATLGVEGHADFAPSAPTPVSEPGKYQVLFGNVDDQLLLWIDGDLIQFDGPTTYDADAVFGGRERIVPRTSPADADDLAPAGIGARGAKLAVSRLAVWRDIYYIAAHWKESAQPITDLYPAALRLDLARRPEVWEEFSHRRAVEFRLGADQFFVMGDNSPESSDARLWLAEDGRPGKPGGAYLEREMLIGKAVCVYWPHAWYTIPGTRIPIWPNFRDMRLVR